ncbi:MAG TPA: hypothetical protein PKG90_13865, partial [Chitinophagaceae bacterium]|nr:hypothetical protein [Chitinophagaceae bacterium]
NCVLDVSCVYLLYHRLWRFLNLSHVMHQIFIAGWYAAFVYVHFMRKIVQQITLFRAGCKKKLSLDDSFTALPDTST